MYIIYRIACLAIVLAVFSSVSVSQTAAAPAVAKIDAEKWRTDLKFMASEMEIRHKNLFHTMSREKFEAAVNALDRRIPTLSRDQIIVEMMRIVAMVGDGHSNIYPTRDAKIGFRSLPVKLYLFSDGMFVRSADGAHS